MLAAQYSRNKYVKVPAMKRASLLCPLAAAAVALVALSACGPTQTDLANPVVKGDRSTIQGDAKATALQKSGPE